MSCRMATSVTSCSMSDPLWHSPLAEISARDQHCPCLLTQPASATAADCRIRLYVAGSLVGIPRSSCDISGEFAAVHRHGLN